MLATTINNLFVLFIYCVAGILVLLSTNSKLAAIAPWAVFSIHLIQAGAILCSAAQWMGWLSCLALIIPHGCIEITGLVLGCNAGTKLCKGQRPYYQITTATVLIVLGAYVETYITPFPFGHWLS